ncbi:MAG: hypothetical protein QOD26_1333 [Betaproteobacteria bacterium]|jgi:hypothetical protein|nr:hypothetical protein [Betaproteobacteria bacterium]
MSARIVAILVVLLVVLGGAALLTQREDSGRRPQNVAALGQPLFKDLKAADIARIRIVEPKSTLTLDRKENGWVIAERDGFPADFARVREFVVKVVGLKIAQTEPVGEKDRARLNLDASATQLEFAGADGKPLARLLLGKKLFRAEPENPEKALGDGRFVMSPEDDKTVSMIPDPLVQATAKTAEWIDRRSFQIEKVKTLEVRYPGGESWRLERAAENAPWKLADQRPGEKIDSSRANAATYSLGLLDLADIAPKDASPQATGLDKPIRLNATTLDGLSYAVRIGKIEGENFYVSFESAGTLRKDAKPEDAERIKKVEERLPKDKALAQHVLLVPKSRLEDTLKKRGELVEKKDTKK